MAFRASVSPGAVCDPVPGDVPPPPSASAPGIPEGALRGDKGVLTQTEGDGGLPGGGRPELSLDGSQGRGEGLLPTPGAAGGGTGTWGPVQGGCGTQADGSPKALSARLSQTCGGPQISPLSRSRNCIVAPESILQGSDEVFRSLGVLILSERARGKLNSLITLQ